MSERTRRRRQNKKEARIWLREMSKIREVNSQPNSQVAIGVLFERFPERVRDYEIVQVCGPFSDQELDNYHIEHSRAFPDGDNYLFRFPPPEIATAEEVIEAMRRFIKEIKRDFWLQKKGLKT